MSKICKNCGCIYPNEYSLCPTCNSSEIKTFSQKTKLTTKNTQIETIQPIKINKYGLFFINIVIFIFCISMSTKDDDIYTFIGCLAMLAIPVFAILFIVDGIKLFLKKSSNVTNDDKQTRIQNKINTTTQAELEQQKRRNESKYKNYNYSHEKLSSSIQSLSIDLLKKMYENSAKDEHARLKRAKYENFSFVEYNPEKYTATTINSEQTKKYKTTLTSCTCGDYRDRKLPCKHMYRLADGIAFDLYRPGEKETVNKLLILWDNRSLVPTLIDIFYRIRDKKNKYYLKVTPSIKRLAELELIKINEIPLNDFVDLIYNTNELKGLLYEKQFKKSISKKELIELFITDEKLIKKLPKNIKHITLNFDESQNENIIECLNYINYQD